MSFHDEVSVGRGETTGRTAEQLALDLLATSVEHDEWFRREVEKGRASARAERLLERDELVARIEKPLSHLMRVRWTADAADDLERIADYIAADRPETAGRIAQDIVRTVDALDTFPNRVRPRRVEGTREPVLAPLPFIAVYEVHADEVQVLRVLHGAQQRPPP